LDAGGFSRRGLSKAYPLCVQEETVQWRLPRHAGRGSIEPVACNGVADPGQMHTDLVRAPRSDAHFEESKVPVTLEHAVFGYRRPPRPSAPSFSLNGPVARDRFVDLPPLGLHAVYRGDMSATFGWQAIPQVAMSVS
jgi:hypothetical protein